MARPRDAETRGRTRELLRLLSTGLPTLRALREARVDPDRFAKLLDEDDFWAAYQAMREAEAIARAA